MSQSPVDPIFGEAARDYLTSWSALTSMIQRGRSFSGRERNCAFLNVGSGRWADVSAVIGLNQIDDGRAVATSDWDQDGDLDLWITNRTAPRVRFLRNDLDTHNGFLQLRLVGTKANRDAIGARVEVHFGGSSNQKLIQTLRAGDGFVSQSSKWLHFGLAGEPTIERVVVRWPNQARDESFYGLLPNRRYEIVQGKADANAVETHTRRELKLQPSEPSLPPPTEQSRIVLTRRRDAPKVEYEDLFRQPVTLTRPQDTAVLVNLWASWCPTCVAELSELATGATHWRTKKLKVVALCADLLTPEHVADLSHAMSFLKASRFPFDIGVALPETVRRLTLVHNQAIYRERPLPLPASFLIDRQGRLAVIYKGPLTSAQLLADLEMLEMRRPDRKSLAFPFPGRDGLKLFPLTAIGFAQAYQDAGYFDDAEQELVRFLVESKPAPSGNLKPVELAYYQLGMLLQAQQRWHESAAVLRKALGQFAQSPNIRAALAIALWHENQHAEANEHLQYTARIKPNNGEVLLLVGTVYLQLQDFEQAASYCQRAVDLMPHDSDARIKLAIVRQAQNQTQAAIDLYNAVLDAHPQSHDALNNLAWIHATNSQQRFRDGDRAVSLAQRLCELTDFQIPAFLDTLGAAQAETGDFAQAAATIERATELAYARGQHQLADELDHRLSLFRSHKPFRESSR